MTPQPIRFDDGAAYERGMAPWSQLAGTIFLDWLEPKPGLRWLDVGCGNGAFTELIVQRCAPAETQGIDPSEGQLTFARTRPGTNQTIFQIGDATALPFDANRFDAAIMALVIFFVPDPPKGVAEMARVVAPGGLVAAYAWDMEGGGFPFHPLQAELRAMGQTPAAPPSASASRMDAMQDLWTQAGLTDIETTQITVRRDFPAFEDYWANTTAMANTRGALIDLTEAEIDQLRTKIRTHLTEHADGHLSFQARANAIKGRVP